MREPMREMLFLAGLNESANYPAACGWLMGGMNSAKNSLDTLVEFMEQGSSKAMGDEWRVSYMLGEIRKISSMIGDLRGETESKYEVR